MIKVKCEICEALHSNSEEVIETGAKSTVIFTDVVVINRNEEGYSWENGVVVCRYCALRYDAIRTNLEDVFRGKIVIDHPDTNEIFLVGEPTAEDYAAYINGETGRYDELV